MVNSSMIYSALEPTYQNILKGIKSEWTKQSICIKIKSDPSIFDELLDHFKNSTDPDVAIIFGLTCSNDFSQIKELLQRTLLHQFPISASGDLILTMSTNPLAGLVLADSLENNWTTFQRILTFNQWRRLLHYLAEITHHSTMIPSLLQSRQDTNQIGMEMLIRDVTHTHEQAVKWSQHHKLRFICYLRKFYHTSPGHECKGVL